MGFHFELEGFWIGAEAAILVGSLLGSVEEGPIRGDFSAVRNDAGGHGKAVLAGGKILKFLKQNILIFLVIFLQFIYLFL